MPKAKYADLIGQVVKIAQENGPALMELLGNQPQSAMDEIRTALDDLGLPVNEINNREVVEERYKSLIAVYHPAERRVEQSPAFDRIVYAWETLRELNGWEQKESQ